MKRIALTLAVVLHAAPAFACSVGPDWRPPTPRSAFESAQVVLHARVLSQTGVDDSTVTIEVLGVLKGTFSGKAVKAGSGSMCGMQLADGREYVFFFPKGNGYFVSFINQPADLTVAQILSSLPQSALPKAAAHVPEPSRPSGQYFQLGYRGPTPPTTNDPDPVVNLQIDLGTSDLCEARLSKLSQSNKVTEALGRESLWCSAKSASTKLEYLGVFRNKATGKSVRVESADISLCTSTVEALTGGQAPNNKIEVTTACGAK
jgi:hypothetical protein